MANEVRQADVPGSHRADLAEMRAQTARADKAEAEAAALRGLLMDVKDYGVRCDCSCECTCGANDVEENIGHVLAAADAGGALVEELARLREAVYGPRDMTRNETAECMVKRLRDEREHYRANWLAEVQRANAAEKERDYYKDWVANWEQLYKERDAEIAQRDRRIAELEAALREIAGKIYCDLPDSDCTCAATPASPATIKSSSPVEAHANDDHLDSRSKEPK